MKITHTYTHTKASLIEALNKFACQKPRLQFANYQNAKSYCTEVRAIGKQLATARILLRAVELSGAATLFTMLEVLKKSDQLSLLDNGELECAARALYRSAICEFCARILWQSTRELYPHFDATELRAYFRRYFGKWIQFHFFN